MIPGQEVVTNFVYVDIGYLSECVSWRDPPPGFGQRPFGRIRGGGSLRETCLNPLQGCTPTGGSPGKCLFPVRYQMIPRNHRPAFPQPHHCYPFVPHHRQASLRPPASSSTKPANRHHPIPTGSPRVRVGSRLSILLTYPTGSPNAEGFGAPKKLRAFSPSGVCIIIRAVVE